MVTIEYIAHAALHAYEAMGGPIARATLRALGIPAPPRRKLPKGMMVSCESYTEYSAVMECFENRESPMDGYMGAAV